MGRHKLLRRLLIVVVALGVVYGVAHLAISKVSTGQLRPLVEKNLTQALGLEVSLDELSVALVPTPHLHAEGIRVANAPGRVSPHLLSIDQLELGVELWPLRKRIIVIDELRIEGAELHIETDAQGKLPGDLAFGGLVDDGDKDPLQLELRQLDIETLHAFYRDGQSEASYSLVLDSVGVESEDFDSEVSLEAKGAFEGSGFALSGKIGSLRELLKTTRPFPVDLTGQLFEASVEAKGTVREPWKAAGLELEISGEIPKLVIEGQPLPQLGAIRFAGHLSDLDGSLGLEGLSLDTTKTTPVRVTVAGKLDDLLELKEVDITAQIETDSLDFLAPLIQPRVDFPLPAIGSLSADLKLAHGKEGLRIDGTVHATTPGDAIVMDAKGGARDLTGAPKIDVKLHANAADLTSITAMIPEMPKHGALGPVTASGHLKTHAGTLGASGIKLRVGSKEKVWAELDGKIANIVKLQDVELELNFGTASLHHMKELIDRELPRTTPHAGSARISDKDGSLGVEHVRLHGGENSPVEIHLEGRFDDLPGRNEFELELGLRGDDTRVLGAIGGVDLPVITPVEFHGKVHGSDEHIELEKMTLLLGKTHLRGSMSGSFAPNTRPAAKARLASKHVRLQDLGLDRSDDASASPSSDAKQSGGGLLDGKSVLPFEDLHHVDLDLGLNFDRLTGYEGLDASNVRLGVQLQAGELKVTDVGAVYEGGEVSADLRADARAPVPKLEIVLHTKRIDLARLMSQFQQDTDYSGLIDADLDLKASGDTLDALRQSVGGTVGFSVREGNAASQIAREFVINLAGAVFPGMTTKKLPSIGCGAVDLEIEDGIATVSRFLLIEKEITVTGTGQVDFAPGSWDLHLVPKTSNPGIISVAPSVDVKGPLDDPSFHPLKRTLVTSLGRGLWKNVRKAGKSALGVFSSGSKTKLQKKCRPSIPGA